MKRIKVLPWAMWSLAFTLTALPGLAADYPAPQEGSWVVRDFRFHTGEVLPELRLHYPTVGAPSGEPVLILHGTTGSGAGLLTPAFAGELFGPGQPLDATRYYIILTDAVGTGKSSKPSDGLKARFPKYNYDDMVDAQYRLVSEHLGVRHLRLVLGNSMGGMQTWIWAQKYPGFMDVAVPMASLPTEMASRNWVMGRLLIDTIRNDPEWMGGNPPETGVLDREIKRVKNGRVFLIPASEQTAGHGTTGQAKFWKQALQECLQAAPRLAK